MISKKRRQMGGKWVNRLPVSDEPLGEGQDCPSAVESEVGLGGDCVGHDDG